MAMQRLTFQSRRLSEAALYMFGLSCSIGVACSWRGADEVGSSQRTLVMDVWGSSQHVPWKKTWLRPLLALERRQH